MEPIPLPPKEPISAKLAKTLHQTVRRIATVFQIVADNLRSVFTALQQKTLGHPLARKLANMLLAWGIIGAGVGVAQWEEYGPALGLFLGGSFVLFLQAYYWQGWENYTKVSRVLKVLFMIGAGSFIAASYPIINAKRGDKPWSDLLHRITFVDHIPEEKLKPAAPLPPEKTPHHEQAHKTKSLPSPVGTLILPPVNDGSDIIVEVGPSPESNYAYETRFTLSNHNSAEILDAYYLCGTQKVDMNAKLPGLIVKLAPAPRLTTGPIGPLQPGDKHSIYCDFSADPWANELERPELNLWVFYQYKGKDMKRGFKFLAIPSQDGKGNFIWLPRGAAEGIKP